ncbi:MAG: class I SAM-dependent methyltransferase [Sphingomonadales bacterium]|nr:class I SAM-dependent methyltransferase [Sphingomonadales bacterium]
MTPLEWAMAYKVSDVIAAAEEDGLLALLADPADARTLAERAGWTSEALAVVLDLLCATGIAESAGAAFRLTAAGRRSLPLLRLERRLRRWHDGHRTLQRALRSNGGEDPLDHPLADGMAQDFAAAMAVNARETALRLRRLLPARRGLRLVDLGGADGAVARALLPGLPGARFTVVDRACFAPLFAAGRGGMSPAQLGFVAADLRDGTAVAAAVRGADVVLALNVAHLLSAAQFRGLLESVAAATATGTLLIVRDLFRPPEGSTGQALFQLVDWLRCGSTFRSSEDDCIAELARAGFDHVRSHRLADAPDAFIVARRR